MRGVTVLLTIALVAVTSASAGSLPETPLAPPAARAFVGALIEERTFGIGDVLPRGPLESGQAMSCDAGRPSCTLGPFRAQTHVIFGAVQSFVGTVHIDLVVAGQPVASTTCDSPGDPTACNDFTTVVPATFTVHATAEPGSTGGYTLYAIFG
ncbi:MAG: hypothetical protein ACYDCK_09490 [Thermoplasmatota archaeon]